MKRAVLTLLLVGSVATSEAEQVLTWPEAVNLALQNNPQLQAAQLTLLARRADYSGSFNGLMPNLNLSTGYFDSHGHPQDSRWEAGGRASMDIFNQAAYADIKSSLANRDFATASLRLAASNVLFNLRQAFANLLFAQEQINVSQRIKEIRERNTELVSLRYTSGRESKGNKLRAQAELMQSNLEVTQAGRDLTAAQQELNNQIGMDTFNVLVATGLMATTESWARPEVWEPLVNEHPTVQIESADLLSAEADLKRSRSALWPVLSANYNRSFQGKEWFPDEPSWSASGILSYPLFGGGPTAAYYSIASSKRSLEKAQSDMRTARNQVRSDLEASWADFAGSAERVDVQRAFLEAARQRNGEADVRYSSGLMTYENWEQIVTDRVNFERSLVSAERDAVVAEARWHRAQGKGLGE